jgi:hypothetical protein
LKTPSWITPEPPCPDGLCSCRDHFDAAAAGARTFAVSVRTACIACIDLLTGKPSQPSSLLLLLVRRLQKRIGFQLRAHVMNYRV